MEQKNSFMLNSHTVEEIAREAADNIGDELSRTSGDKYVLHGILYRHITAAIAPLQAELEQAKERLWSIGLLPSYFDTLPKAVEAAVRMVATLRETIHDPPPDLQESVIHKLDLVSRDALTNLQSRLAAVEADTKWVAQAAQ